MQDKMCSIFAPHNQNVVKILPKAKLDQSLLFVIPYIKTVSSDPCIIHRKERNVWIRGERTSDVGNVKKQAG
jgi:hypothetical protein